VYVGANRFTGQEAIQQPRRRPEGSRQGSPYRNQEGGIPCQLPRLHLQPPKGRQTTRNEVVDCLGFWGVDVWSWDIFDESLAFDPEGIGRNCMGAL